MRKAVFLDRDGVINRLLTERGPRETPRLPEEFELLPGVPLALARLKRAGFLLLVITNQPNVAKGKCSLAEYHAIDRKMHILLPDIDGVYACLHHPDPKQVVRSEYLQVCTCRKPQPGLIKHAQSDLDIDVDQSWLIGDDETDLEAGLNASLRTTQLIKIGTCSSLTEVVVSSLLEAAHYIIRRSDGPEPSD